MNKVSIFTPTHDTKFLNQLYASIKNQDFYEWIIVYNNGAVPIKYNDKRVKPFILPFAPEWVGSLKAYACEQATGDILLEIDHDDWLESTAIEEVKKAFKDPKIGFAYSNTIHSKKDHFSEVYGWKYREYSDSHEEHISFPPTPESISKIWFAPNHLRAFRRSVYEEVGGYNKGMRVLDDLDLMCRMYLKTKFYHIDKGLYQYRIHGENTFMRYNEEIQHNVWRIHDQFIQLLATKYADDNNLLKVELGGRFNATPGFTTIDLKDADIVCDLNEKWKLEDNSVYVIIANDIFEHLKDPIFTMKEVSRVLVPGGILLCKVPSTDGRGAFQDPTHVSFWNENSFLYYTDKNFAKYIDTPVRFQTMRVYTTEKDSLGVCWTIAHLLNLKDGYRTCSEIKI
jgi:SAM-dependent methyltransferase